MSFSSPCMSDKSLLMSVEDLISIAMGPDKGNVIDFKMVQTVLHILARQMRLLEQKVVVVAGELPLVKPPSSKDARRRSSQSRDSGSFLEEEDSFEEKNGHRGRRGSRSESGIRRERDGVKGGRGRSRPGRVSIDDGEETGGRRRRQGSEDDYEDRHGGRGRSEGRGTGQDSEIDERGGRGRRGRDDERDKSRGGRDRADDDGKDKGGHGGPHVDGDDDGKDDRGISRGGGADDGSDERGGHGRSRGQGGRQDEEDGRAGRGKSGKRDVEDYHVEEEPDRDSSKPGRQGKKDGRAGHGRSGKPGMDDYDDEEEDGRAGRGKSGKRGVDDYGDEKEAGRGRSQGGRQDEEDGRAGRGKSGKRGVDDYDDEDEADRGSSKRGRQGKKDGPDGRGRSGKPGMDDYDDEEEDGRAGRGKSGKRGVDDYGDEKEAGHRSGGRGRDDYSEESAGKGRHRDERSGAGGGHKGRDAAEGTGRDKDRRVREGSDHGSDRRGKGGKDDGRGGEGGIDIHEVDGPGQEKLLVVVKSPTRTSVGSDRDRRESIAVVTQSQFRLLQDAVEALREVAGPLPPLTMPDNTKLRQDLAAGASLTDAMQAMQVEARVKAAEEAVGQLGGLLTQLVASGALPPDAARDAIAGGWGQENDLLVQPPAAAEAEAPKSRRFVTEPEMEKALKVFKQEMTQNLQSQMTKAATGAEAAEATAKTMGGKVEDLLKMISRVSAMQTMVEDYSQQLDGFDAGLATQMQTFKEQLSTMRADLHTGMQQLEMANSNAETAAVMELNERYEELVHGLEETLLLHTSLTTTQNQLTLELKNLLENVEMLKEEKADRDELLDGLRDKADLSRLEGLVRQEEFVVAQEDLEGRIEQCNEKFLLQDERWKEALRDLAEEASTKAQALDLLKIRDEATAQLRAVDEKLKRLELMLGEPQAAMLMRRLSRDAVCGACLAPALMAPGEAAAPAALPAARPAPPEEPCPPVLRGPPQPDLRTHRCHRWVGGSHTLLSVAHEHTPPPAPLPDVTRKYTGYGDDGRLYWMESATELCAECNPALPPAPPSTARSAAGAGDGGGAGPCACDSITDFLKE